ncbi:hypothetical protein COOONC_27690 [Cooperia oncophora]
MTTRTHPYQDQPIPRLPGTRSISRGCQDAEVLRDGNPEPATLEKFEPDEETGHTFDYWYRRYGPMIRESSVPYSKKIDLILLKPEDSAYRRYADDILPLQPHEIDFDFTAAKLQKLFASEKTYITCPALTPDNIPFREYADMIKRMDEEACLKNGLHGAEDFAVRRKLDTQAEDAPLTIEDLVAECENFTI